MKVDKILLMSYDALWKKSKLQLCKLASSIEQRWNLPILGNVVVDILEIDQFQ